MRYGKHCFIPQSKKDDYIKKLAPQLASLRARAGLSQDELSGLIGVSRQTYCLTESGARSMSWNTYLSIVMFFEKNSRTRDLMRSLGIYSDDIFAFINPEDAGKRAGCYEADANMKRMFSELDEEGLNCLNATLICEYGRCNDLSRNEILKLMNELL